MTEHYVSYYCAGKLKELGFDWPCERFYINCAKFSLSRIEPFSKWKNWNDTEGKFSAPPIHMAAKWLREVKGISIEPYCNMVRQWNVSVCMIEEFGETVWSKIGVDTYESALSAGIDKALELLGKEATDE